MSSSIAIPGYEPQPDEDMEIPAVWSGAWYFRTLGVRMLRGRERSELDRDTLPRVVVNEAMALRYWGSADPIGTFVRLGGAQGRAGGEMARNDVGFRLVQLHTMRDVLHSSLSVSRAVSQTLMVMGVLAIVLAAVGLYGVVSYMTNGRAREFGVRLALGASPSTITRLVLGYGLRVAVAGGAIGLILGVVALRGIQDMLFGSAAYGLVGIAVAAFLVLVTLVACAVPAFRATSVSASSSLRAL